MGSSPLMDLAEGRSKAQVAARVGSDRALASERSYALRVLPRCMAGAVWHGAPLRAAAIASGLALTTAGYVGGRLARSLPACARRAEPVGYFAVRKE